MIKTEHKRILKRTLTPHPLGNLIKSLSSYYLSLLTKKSTIWGMPPFIMIEPTSICNLKCPLCPSGTGKLERTKGFMDINLYKKVIDEVKDTTIMIILWNQGEPLLHENLIEMIRYNHSYGLFTMTSSNLNHLPDPEGLVQSGLDTLIVSLDGASQETYNKYRVNGDFQTVISNTEALIKAKKKLSSTTPVIKWQFIVMKHNEHEIQTIKELAKKIGVDELVFKTVQIYDKSDIDTFLPVNEKYRRYEVIGDNYRPKGKIRNRCRRIFTQPVVNCDGELAICCFDKDNKYKVGNLTNHSFRELWNSSNFHKWRNIVLQDRKKMDICQNCGEGINLTLKNV